MALTFSPSQENWQQVYFVSNFTQNRLVCPVLLTSPIIALFMAVPVFLDATKWHLGAYVQREIFTGLTVGGSNDARLNGARKLFVNRSQVFTYNEALTYSLVISPFIYGDGTSLSVWEYTGVFTQ